MKHLMLISFVFLILNLASGFTPKIHAQEEKSIPAELIQASSGELVKAPPSYIYRSNPYQFYNKTLISKRNSSILLWIAIFSLITGFCLLRFKSIFHSLYKWVLAMQMRIPTLMRM